MNSAIIEVQQLSKEYLIGEISSIPTLRECLASAFSTLFSSKNQNQSKNILIALKSVSFSVNAGEVVGIIGKNGAGKSTLLKILSRITPPTSGKVILRGRVASLLEVGTGFHPELTGRENIFLNGSILGMRRHEIYRQFEEIVEFSELDKFIDTPVKKYSSGMYVRLAFAVAAHLQPEILLVDEVLAVGDVSFQKKCLGKMTDVAQTGRTIIFVSHNLTAIQKLCNRVLLFSDGCLIQEGNPSSVCSYYLQESFSQKTEYSWPDSPVGQNTRVQMKRISVHPPKNTSLITIHSPIHVDVEFINNIHNACLYVTIYLFNIQGECVFVTTSPAEVLEQGLYKHSFVIPKDFLNDGTYTFKALIVQDHTILLLEQDLSEHIVFQVHELQRDIQWHGKWAGIVRPKIDWNIEKLEPYTSSFQNK